ncbi:aspartate aminotransferase family protein [Flammeovirgaceae bacterium SG7u.111]|nr:aspartate aminotransferase family protein [Flammeovirgaceae bacterium SG7u.132]WPO34060.1 aspartate aminotransferase family protein [Flammeovirgaceae bacterium SG7u.111]
MDNAKDIFFQHLAQTSEMPVGLEIERTEGIYLYDKSGRAYMDLISGIGVSHLGHGNPKVKKAIHDQVEKHTFVMVYGEYLQAPQLALVQKLAEVLPKQLETTYIVNSGTEANEAALKLAKRATGRTELISCYRSYHGNTHGSLSVSGNEVKKQAFRPLLPDVKFIHFNVEEDLTQITTKTAAVIIEPVQGDAGVRIPDKSYLKALRKRCDETGTLLIFDEIQTGFGRTGSLFAFEQFDVVPDILTMGKALGGGMPIGAFSASHELMKSFTNNPPLGHITTFGGHPVCCAAAHAALEVLLEENILDHVHQKGQLFRELLQHPLVKEIRSIGLMFAIELDSFEVVNKVVEKCIERGVIGYWFLSTKNSFRIAPPLIIIEEEIRKAAAIIRECMDECL